MHIHICYSETHRVFVDEWFLKSLNNSDGVFQVTHHRCATKVAGRGDAFGPEFGEVLNFKMNEICRSIIDFMGEIIIWSDVDIQFFKDCLTIKDELLRQIGDKDIAFQSEGNDAFICNTGFIILKCNYKTLSLFSYLASRVAYSGESEQIILRDIINNEDFLEKIRIDWTVLDNKFWAFSHLKADSEIYLHHANYTLPTENLSSVDNKLRQLSDVKNIVQRFGIFGPNMIKNISVVKWELYHPNGALLSDRLILDIDGSIQGYDHPSERRWRVDGGRIIFISEDWRVTSYFHLNISNDNCVIGVSAMNGLRIIEQFP